MDIYNIPPDDHRDPKALQEADVLLVIMGRSGPVDRGGSRDHDPADCLRVEVELRCDTAFDDSVLVGGAACRGRPTTESLLRYRNAPRSTPVPTSTAHIN